MSDNTAKPGFFKKLFTSKPSCCCSMELEEVRVEIYEQDLSELPNVSDELSKNDIGIKWYSYSSEPEKFKSNKLMNGLLEKSGKTILPVTVIDGIVKKTGSYPAESEIYGWLGIKSAETNKSKCEYGGSGCC